MTAKFFPKEIYFDLLDTRFLEKQIALYNPDLIYLGHTYILSKALLPFLATLKIPVVYDEGGSGLIEAWTEHGRWFRFTGDYRSRFAILNRIKPLVIKVVCKLGGGRIKPQWAWPENMHIVFNSELNRSNALATGVPVKGASVIHSGIDTGKFSFLPRTQWNTPLKIIVPGRIERRKGQLDAVRLLKQLLEVGIDTRLILAGPKWVDGYYDEVVDVIQDSKVADYCTVFPMLSQDDLIKLYQSADICFFTSCQEIGFSRTPLEAMACGCIVISYGNEGSDEVVRDYKNGFIVNPCDEFAVVDLVKRMIANPEIIKKVTATARNEIEEGYKLEKYVEKIEQVILDTQSNYLNSHI